MEAVSAELRPLEYRIKLLQGLRMVVAALVLGIAVVSQQTAAIREIVLATGIYSALIVWVLVLSRIRPSHAKAANSLMLLADGLFLSLVVTCSGGPRSPQAFLVYVQLIGVSLLLSYRAGIKLTIWHTLLLVASYAVVAAGYVEVEKAGFDRFWWLHAMAFWVIAGATAVFSRINESELRRGKSELSRLARMGRELEDADNVGDVSRLVATALCDFYGFRRAFVAVRSSGGTWTLAPGNQVSGELLVFPGTDSPDDLVSVAWERHAPLLVASVSPDRNPMIDAILPNACQLILLPLVADGRPQGFFVGEYGPGKSRVDRRVLDMMGQFCAHGALALRNTILMDEINRLAAQDGLTGLANRREFDRRLSSEIARTRREGGVVSLVLFDIDKFKAVNDTHGHVVGDDVLRHAALALQSACREMDTPARYGGEEFAVIMPATDMANALVGAERLRSAVANSQSPVPITMSAGIASCSDKLTDMEALIALADEALYESKRNGRDQSSCARTLAINWTSSNLD